MLTTSSVFLKTLSEAGVTHAFANWGSDHPALLEEIERLRVAQELKIKIITCPNEMVALSAAQGYAQVTGKPAAVLCHVDVGTQTLAGAVHNVDRGRVPVLIYAGAAPHSTQGELRGSRNEFIFWWQDCVDQPSIVRQYMRHAAQIYSAKNVGMVVRRALQFATSDPKGPVYVWGRREAMEEEVDEKAYSAGSIGASYAALESAPISIAATEKIVTALIESSNPLVITSYLGRNPAAVQALVELSEILALPVLSTCPTHINFPSNHSHFLGTTYFKPPSSPDEPNALEMIKTADTILILDSDIPIVPISCKPRPGARIFHIDIDPLKDNIGTFHVDAEVVCKADTAVAVPQLVGQVLASLNNLQVARPDSEILSTITERSMRISRFHSDWMRALINLETYVPSHDALSVPNVLATLRTSVPPRTLFLNEGVSNFPLVWNCLRPDLLPGSPTSTMISSGGSSLGWGLGAAVGAHLGLQEGGRLKRDDASAVAAAGGLDLICLVVGDGSFLFGIPSTAYWMARRYQTPFLTIILNNGGWKSPRSSMLNMHPSGFGSRAQSFDLNVTFGPEPPDYSAIATAAGGAWDAKVSTRTAVSDVISSAVRVVLTERRCAVVDCIVESF